MVHVLRPGQYNTDYVTTYVGACNPQCPLGMPHCIESWLQTVQLTTLYYLAASLYAQS